MLIQETLRFHGPHEFVLSVFCILGIGSHAEHSVAFFVSK
jgi:hypothetical protein